MKRMKEKGTLVSSEIVGGRVVVALGDAHDEVDVTPVLLGHGSIPQHRVAAVGPDSAEVVPGDAPGDVDLVGRVLAWAAKG